MTERSDQSGVKVFRAGSAISSWFREQLARWVDYLILTVVLATVITGLIIVFRQYYPDTAHYLGMSLWFSGWSQSDALNAVNARHLAAGYEPNSSVDALFNWGLVKPRVVLPALSVPFILLFGQIGLGVTTVLITIILTFSLYLVLANRFGRFAAVITLLLMMSSYLIMTFNVAMLTESLSALWGLLTLVAAWRYQRTRHWGWVLAMVVVTTLSAFTRQATFIVAAAFLVAWIGSLFVASDRRQRWGLPALFVTGTAIVMQLLQSWIFPNFSQLDQYLRMTKTTNLWDALLATPGLVLRIVKADAVAYIAHDQTLIVIIILCLISIAAFWKRSESHLLVGAILGIALYNITNGNATEFRYAIPGLAFFMVSLALLISRIGNQYLRYEDPNPSAKTPIAAS